jgi:uncharacterized RDD family membrane protein YckC
MIDKKPIPQSDTDTGIYYEIKVKGHLEEHWSDWLGGLQFSQDTLGNTHLTGIVPDQAALHGILSQIRNLGLPLISLTPQGFCSQEMELLMKNSNETLKETQKDIQYAGFAKRLKAFAFDYLPIAGYITLLFTATLAVIKISGFLNLPLHLPENPVLGDLIAFITLVLPVALYFSLQESSPRQATWGKHKAGIRVVDAKGETLSRTRAFVRSLFKLVPWQIAHTCIFQMGGFTLAPIQPTPLVTAGFVLVYVLVGIYAASALISKKHRTHYDWATGSYVIVEKTKGKN